MRGRVRASCVPTLPRRSVVVVALLLAFAYASARARDGRALTTPHILILSTTDGGVLGLDAATGARIFELPRPLHHAVSSWAAHGQPQYILALNGALFRVHPNTGVAEKVDDAFLASGGLHCRFADDSAPPSSVYTAGIPSTASSPAVSTTTSGNREIGTVKRDLQPDSQLRHTVVLRRCHTEIVYIDGDSGAVLRTVTYDSPTIGATEDGGSDNLRPSIESTLQGSCPGDYCGVAGVVHDSQGIETLRVDGSGYVILLARTSIDVRVLDARTGSELANASLTHVTPSLMDRYVCHVPSALDPTGLPGDPKTRIDDPAGVMFTSFIDVESGGVTMLSLSGDRVLWRTVIDTDIMDAYGLGAVNVLPHDGFSELKEADEGSVFIPVSYGLSCNAENLLNVPSTTNLTRRVKHRLRVRGRGDAKYAMLADDAHSDAKSRAGDKATNDYDLNQRADTHTSTSQEYQFPPRPAANACDVARGSSGSLKSSPQQVPVEHPNSSDSIQNRRNVHRAACLVSSDQQVSSQCHRNDGCPTQEDPTPHSSRQRRDFFIDGLQWLSSLLQSFYKPMALSVALGIGIGIGLLVTARLLRVRNAGHERESVYAVSSPMSRSRTETAMAMTPTFHTRPATLQSTPPVTSDVFSNPSEASWQIDHLRSRPVPIPLQPIRNTLEVATSNAFSIASGSHPPPERFYNGWMRVGHLEISPIILGRGAYGTVVKEGRMMPGGRRVAVKQLSREFYDNAREEISLLVELDEHSPHVVRYFTMEEDDQYIYLALELCAGSMCDRVMAGDIPAPPLTYARGPPPHFTWRALRQLMKGLADIHERDIVHLDLKPHNVLVTRDNFDVKLADIGLSRRLLEPDRTAFNAVPSRIGGVETMGWRAPEVLTGAQQAKAVDIFSAGCIVAYVLTKGVHPFGPVAPERDRNIMEARADLGALEALDVPEAVDIVRRMIASVPSQRPSAAEALMHPFFWTDAKKLTFLCDIWNRLSELRNRSAAYTEFIESLDNSELAERCEGWPSRMPSEIITEMARSHQGRWSVSSLLRYIRNKRAHYSQLTPSLQRLLGPLPDEDSRPDGSYAHTSGSGNGRLAASPHTPVEAGYPVRPQEHEPQTAEDNFLLFFQRRVPYLLMCVYSHACSHPALVRSDHFRHTYGFQNMDALETPPILPSPGNIAVPALNISEGSGLSDTTDQGRGP